MSDSNVQIDQSKLSKCDQLLFRLESLLSLMSGFIILAIVLLSVANVLGRWLFSAPISGYIDWIEQSMAFFAFLGIAYVQRQGGHIRMDMLVGRLRKRILWSVELVSTLLMLSITVILISGSFSHFLRAYQIGDSSLDIDLPTWPSKLVVPIALTLLSVRLILQIWGYFRAIKQKNDNDEAIAVPLIESVESVAEKEATLVAETK
jgi:TRAP-type C4-dicarboxylate transport system permease small subunit